MALVQNGGNLNKNIDLLRAIINLVRLEVSCNSDLVQYPNSHSFAADLLEGEREQCPFGSSVCSPRHGTSARAP